MQMPEGEPHPSTLPGFRGRRDPERSVTRSRSGRKKKRVKFEDVQPQDIPNPTEDNFPRRCITQLPDGVSHIYYTGKELTNRDSMRVHGTFTSVFKVWKFIATLPAGSAILASLYHGLDIAVKTGGAITGFVQLLPYWFYEYCGVGHPIVKEEVKYPAYPRLRAWVKGNKRKTNDQAANLFIIGRYHIDHRTVEMITWEPWFDSAVSETEDVTGEVRIPLDPPLSMSPYISPATLHEMRQAGFVDCEQFVVGEVRGTYTSYWAEQISEVGHMLTDSQRMGNLDLFGPSALRAGIILVVVTSASVHSLSLDFSLPGKAEGPDLGWHMQWTGRRENLPIARLRDPPPMSSSYDTEELWHLTHGIRRLVLTESARDAQRIQEVEKELAIASRQLDSIDHQLYAHDLQLRRWRDVRVVPLPPGGGARTRQRGSGPRTRRGSTSRRGQGTGDDSE
ncbi:hypothetical protein GIB67_036620 [Kingdonia uniflora]|uniref:Aminotransferase-like plant mobile domain-containing protein n=1 Tax=Kingdonia uniflora TaxID=39325 RepID=A0A7J7M0L0_9MAGN|nr:hypothetical protein GIB67_036620 [Kingdonia uniflora]